MPGLELNVKVVAEYNAVFVSDYNQVQCMQGECPLQYILVVLDRIDKKT